MIPKTTAVEYQGRRERAEQLGARLPDEAWSSPPAAARGGEATGQQWACLVLTTPRHMMVDTYVHLEWQNARE